LPTKSLSAVFGFTCNLDGFLVSFSIAETYKSLLAALFNSVYLTISDGMPAIGDCYRRTRPTWVPLWPFLDDSSLRDLDESS